MTSGSKLYPGLLAGGVIGLLSSLPFVNLANCCCVWIFGGGVLASYLYQHNQDEPMTVSDALAVGALAAVAGSLLGLVVSIPIHYITAPIMQRFVLQILESSQDVPAELRELLENVSLSGAGLVLGFLFSLVLYLFFVPAGALVGALIFQKKPIVPPPSPSTHGPTGLDPAALTPPPLSPEAHPIEDAPSTPHTDESTPKTADDADDDDLPPSSAPPSQPPPLPTV